VGGLYASVEPGRGVEGGGATRCARAHTCVGGAAGEATFTTRAPDGTPYRVLAQGPVTPEGGTLVVAVPLGLAIGTVGMEPISGFRRFTFGSMQLAQGLELVPIIMGLYGVAEVLVLAEEGLRSATASQRSRHRSRRSRRSCRSTTARR